VATQERPNIGDEARNAVTRLLIERVRQDKYPSATHMDLIEETIPPWLMRDYLNVLLEKLATDNWPSIPLMHRVAKISQQL
jgi:hypothetical protein